MQWVHLRSHNHLRYKLGLLFQKALKVSLQLSESDYETHANEEKIQGDTQDDTQGDTQDDTQEKIIKMIKENPQVSTADMAKELKIGIATVKRKIKKMSNVSYVGSGYSGHWEINE